MKSSKGVKRIVKRGVFFACGLALLMAAVFPALSWAEESSSEHTDELRVSFEKLIRMSDDERAKFLLSLRERKERRTALRSEADAAEVSGDPESPPVTPGLTSRHFETRALRTSGFKNVGSGSGAGSVSGGGSGGSSGSRTLGNHQAPGQSGREDQKESPIEIPEPQEIHEPDHSVDPPNHAREPEDEEEKEKFKFPLPTWPDPDSIDNAIDEFLEGFENIRNLPEHERQEFLENYFEDAEYWIDEDGKERSRLIHDEEDDARSSEDDFFYFYDDLGPDPTKTLPGRRRRPSVPNRGGLRLLLPIIPQRLLSG